MTGNLRSANKAFTVFTSRLSSSNPSLGVQDVSSASSDIRVFPTVPLLNFINMLLLTVQRGNADLFRQLTAHYSSQIQEVGIWDDALAHFGEKYFGINIPRQSNPLFDMMGSMLFGGQQGGGRGPQAASRRVEAPRNMELD